MVRNSFLALILIAMLAVTVVAATNNGYTDVQIFAQTEAMGLKLGMPTDSTDAAPAIDPGGQIIRTTECSWLYGRPKNNRQEVLVICEYQSKFVGKVYTAEDGVTTANWSLVITPRNAPQIAGLLEQQMFSNPNMTDFRMLAIRELTGVRSMTFIASREKGVIFPTPEQFKP